MALIVQKFGGTTVSCVENICKVADKVQAAVNAGDQIVVVVSAMAGTTDHLDSLARSISETPDPRELDVLLASGEQITIALMSMALLQRGCKAKSYTGTQVRVQTDSVYNKARITHIDTTKMLADLAAGIVVVVAGFQGVDAQGNITTLGRGGSDTTAVALAAALNADECQIYTDVDGVYTVDPRFVANARQMPNIDFEEMLELSSMGAKVLQLRAVEFAGRYNVPVRVLSAFDGNNNGTLVSFGEAQRDCTKSDQQVVSGITFSRNESRITVCGVPDLPGQAGKILEPISAANIEVDMVVQSPAQNGKVDFSFIVQSKYSSQVISIIDEILDANATDLQKILVSDGIAKLSLVGIGMRSHPWVASKMFTVLGAIGVNIQLIVTSEIKVSVLIDEKHLETGVKALHEAFGL